MPIHGGLLDGSLDRQPCFRTYPLVRDPQRFGCSGPNQGGSAWLLYHIQSPGLAYVQLRVLCRILHVEATPFRELLNNTFISQKPWSDQ